MNIRPYDLPVTSMRMPASWAIARFRSGTFGLTSTNTRRCSRSSATGVAATPIRISAADIRPADNDPGDYYATTNATHHHREQYSCAGLGLAPDTEAFTACVNDLDWTLFDIDHPNN